MLKITAKLKIILIHAGAHNHLECDFNATSKQSHLRLIIILADLNAII